LQDPVSEIKLKSVPLQASNPVQYCDSTQTNNDVGIALSEGVFDGILEGEELVEGRPEGCLDGSVLVDGLPLGSFEG
jgi:hypothetical protein